MKNFDDSHKISDKEIKSKVIEFFKHVFECKEEKYKSVGYGCNCRFESNEVVGSALVHENVVHMVFFRKEKE